MIRIGANTASLLIQQNLSAHSSDLQTCQERLSSGQRINRASDDAAGLAVSLSLNSNSLVAAQAAKNICSGTGLLSITDTSIDELTGITIRQRELATQAVNGVYSKDQRAAISEEATALYNEYNRIVASTKYNDKALLLTPHQSISIQAGSGDDSSIDISLATYMTRLVRDGTFSQSSTTSFSPTGLFLSEGDFNNDGITDVISGSTVSSVVSLALGKADGGFDVQSSLSASGYAVFNALAGDINGDGNLDIVSSLGNGSSAKTGIFLGNGDGSFQDVILRAAQGGIGDSPNGLTVADVNSDGKQDIIQVNDGYSASYNGTIAINLGNGSGGYSSSTVITCSGRPSAVSTSDANNDGKIDLLITEANTGNVDLYLGNGDGSFKTKSIIGNTSSSFTNQIQAADLNSDGNVDIVASSKTGNTMSVLMGNGDGTFKTRTNYAVGNAPSQIEIADIDSDGTQDIMISDVALRIFKGNGDGTFQNALIVSMSFDPGAALASDMNGDGYLDLVSIGSSKLACSLAGTYEVTSQSKPDLSTVSGASAAITVADKTLTKLELEHGSTAAVIARLNVASDLSTTNAEQFRTASTRITDADIAQESATLIKDQILEKTATALFAQANQDSSLVLKLIKAA